MNLIWRWLFFCVNHYAKIRVVREVRRRSTLVYLRAVQSSRLAIIGLLALFLFLQTMMFAFFGLLITGFLLWDHEFQAKLEILFWIFTGMFSMPAILLMIGLSERLWYRASGAEKLVDELRAKN